MLRPTARLMKVWALAAAVAAAVAIGVVPAAHAQDRAYWTETGGPASGLSFAALDGSGGGSLSFTSPGTTAHGGLTVDSAAGRFYWSDEKKIESIAFDGSDQRAFDSGGIAIAFVHSLSIDPGARRLIWTQESAAAPIEIGGLDGTGGGPLSVPGTTIAQANHVVFDPPLGRVYWTDERFSNSPLDYAAIDGSGGAALPLEKVQPDGGLAIDNAGGRIYWVAEGKIRSANLDGSDPVELRPLGATVAEPKGLAIDEATGTIYWGNAKAHALSFAKLDGGGAGQVNIVGALPGNPRDLVLFVAPRNSGAPRLTGTAAPGATLTCSSGDWAPDQPQANLFDAATSLAYRWSRDGAAIPGADAETLTIPAAGSSYGCSVTASNAAGATTTASASIDVPAPPRPRVAGFGAATGLTLALARGPVRGGTLPVTIENFNTFAVTGSLVAGPAMKRAAPAAMIAAQPFGVGAASTAVATLRLPAPLRKLLLVEGALKLRLAARVTDPLGAQREVAASAVAKSKRAKPKRHRHKPSSKGAGASGSVCLEDVGDGTVGIGRDRDRDEALRVRQPVPQRQAGAERDGVDGETILVDQVMASERVGEFGAAPASDVAFAVALHLGDLLLDRARGVACVRPLELGRGAREDHLRHRVQTPRHRAVGAAPERCHIFVGAPPDDELADLARQLQVGGVAGGAGRIGHVARRGQPVDLVVLLGEEAVDRGGHAEDQSVFGHDRSPSGCGPASCDALPRRRTSAAGIDTGTRLAIPDATARSATVRPKSRSGRLGQDN
jgi:hypothetical protein